ncbi:MAG: hypothetical protein JO329_27805, partial [Planctomycetaceae bacterium]|nr:hypothetical protein [Planctomycetaceae bacterium]
MSRPSERLRRLGRHLAALFTGPAAGPRGFTPREGRGVRDEGRVGPLVRLTPHPSPLAPGTGAAPGREGDGPPRRPADAAPRQGEAAAPAREAAAGTPAAGTPEGAT